MHPRYKAETSLWELALHPLNLLILKDLLKDEVMGDRHFHLTRNKCWWQKNFNQKNFGKKNLGKSDLYFKKQDKYTMDPG